ncbi:Uma2 family endonuclease [Desulforamulus aeronauticus]|uniref:Endonuclease, Uma2 family (Restriction endonuclease fold) n=1 Tax=Desulforamulus aeronauticus DSM 10349 TaxID=1121421 RepID=A0A1M6S529_9FIRM|nr:Uma2 family endonuclease [Desulforamulus aeronauticus]SHK39934.1 Endonuclease, Uma2 family (restriction endonuclease fold) [Desulforamulus aeronauticus DSM 10349]
MGNSAIKNDRIYTYADYLSWPETERLQIIDGVAYALAPPSTEHQAIVGSIFVEFANYLKGKACKVFVAPFGVTFAKDVKNEKNIHAVEPDITIICDKSKITERGCKGSPDLIVEVISPSTASVDVIKKRQLYEHNGVLEYWIVDPTNQILSRFYLNENLTEYRQVEYFTKTDTITPVIFPDLQINLVDIFSNTED